MSRMPQVFLALAEDMVIAAGYRVVGWGCAQVEFLRAAEPWDAPRRPLPIRLSDGDRVVAIPDLLRFIRGQA